MSKWTVEYCGRGGSFGVANVECDTASQACAVVNSSAIVHPNETGLTRARIWVCGASEFASHDDAVKCGQETGRPVYAGITK